MASKNPFLGGGTGGSKGNPFLSQPSSGRTKKASNPFLGGGGGMSAAERASSVPVLESEAAAVGAPAPDQDSPGLFRRVADVISRGNYASAGAAEELFTERGGGAGAALKRVGRELFSGIGGLKGDKEGFAQVMEQSGVGEHGSLSEIAPWAFSETGKGVKFQKGGLFDPTGRGTLGLVGDIVLDPLTYINPTKVLAAIPGSKAVASAAKATAKSIPGYDKAIEAVGGIFNRDWKIRNLPGAIKLKQAHLNRQNHATSILHDVLESSEVAAIPRRERAAFVDAMEDGSWTEKYRNNPKMLKAGEQFKALNEGWAAKEVEIGKLGADQVRKNYVSHYYENSPEEFATAMAKWPGGKRFIDTSLGRHQEKRAFNTLKEAEEWSKKAHALDPAVPILKPLRDPLEILKRRGEASIEAIEWEQYQKEIIDAFGRKDIALKPGDIEDLMKAIPVPPHDASKIKWMLRREAPAASEHLPTLERSFVPPKSNFTVPLAEHADVLYRDTDLRGALDFVSENASRGEMNDVHFASTPDLALGQQKNTGVLVELDPRGLGGHLTQKPGWQSRYESGMNEVIGKRNTQEAYQRAVRSITIRPGAMSTLADRARFQSFTLPRMLKSGWTKEVLGDGTIKMTRPLASPERSVLRQIPAAAKATFDSLSWSGRKEFVRNKLLKAKTAKDAMEIMGQYGVENAPKQKVLLGSLAEDGTPYIPFNFGKVQAEIPRSMADDLQDMSKRVLDSKEMNHVLRGFDRMNNVFKSFVTVMFPAFHFRNAYSNVAQGFADVGVNMLNPAHHFDAIGALRGAEGGIVTKAGEHIPYKQLQEEMAKNGVTTTGRRIAEYTGTEGLDRLSTVGGKIKAAPRALGGVIENEARSTLYTIYRKRGMSAADASERVNKFLFDYTNLSRVEQDIFRRAIPFYTFQRKNIERQFRNLATKPGLTAAELKPFRGREDENDNLASWDAEALKIRLNGDGKTLRVLSGVDLPMRNLDFLWNGNLKGTVRQQIGVLSPLLKAPLEVGFGVNAFTGKDMDRQTSNSVGKLIETLNPPKAVQQWMGYKKEQDQNGKPKYTFDGQRFYILFQSWALSRMVSTSDRQFKTFTDDPEWSKIMLNTLTGLQDKTFNLPEEKARRLEERKRQLEDSLVRWGERKTYERTFKPKPR